jgi:RNA 2',3'-cyclic 3'-phosphodiesterase
MRLFLGIDLPDAVTHAAAAIADRLRARVDREAPQARLRWVPPDNLHVTVWFLGEVREPAADQLVAALKRGLTVPCFDLRVAGSVAFPPPPAPRVLWLGLPSGREGLIAIHDRLRPVLTPLGFTPEERTYNPHLTIARVKDISRPDAVIVRRILAETAADAGSCRVDAVTLFRSRTSSHGAQYERLLRVPLEVSTK